MHEDGVPPRPEEMTNFIRDLSGSTLPTTCQDLKVEMQKVTDLLESNIEEALALATHLRQVDSSDFTCTTSQLNSLNKEVSTASGKASDLAKQQTTMINKQFANLTSAFDSIIQAQDDLKKLGKQNRYPILEKGSTVPLLQILLLLLLLCVTLRVPPTPCTLKLVGPESSG